MAKQNRQTGARLSASDYLKLPYERKLVPESDGTYFAEISEFPGCIATGETPAEAFQSLEEVAEQWLESAIAKGHAIAPPPNISSYSGRFLLRVSKTIHQKAAEAAQREGVSLNQLVAGMVAEGLGVRAAQRAPAEVESTNFTMRYAEYGALASATRASVAANTTGGRFEFSVLKGVHVPDRMRANG